MIIDPPFLFSFSFLRALREAIQASKPAAPGKKKIKSEFPADKVLQRLTRDSRSMRMDMTVVSFLMSVLDYVSADVLKVPRGKKKRENR